ncbi:MAG: hypothetical protein ACOY93_09620 [Bacillota bacterium]
MTYLLFGIWIASLLLVAGELDRLLYGPLARRWRIRFPEVHWLTAGLLSACLPGLGQLLNGQLFKALFLLIWPFLIIWGSPVPRPWQLTGLKTGWLLFPWWLIAIADALLVRRLNQRRGEPETLRSEAPSPGPRSKTVDYQAYRMRRRDAGN